VSKNFRNYIRREKKRLLVFFSAGSISFGLSIFATNKNFCVAYAYICTELKLLNHFSNPVQLLIKGLLIKKLCMSASCRTCATLALKGLANTCFVIFSYKKLFNFYRMRRNLNQLHSIEVTPFQSLLF